MQRLLLVVVLCLTMEKAHGDICSSEVNGCSIPFGLNFVYKDFFEPACNRHDVCYRCGAFVGGFGRNACDLAFHKDMVALCKNSRKRRQAFRRHKRLVKRGACEIAASVYYYGVSAFGTSYYHEANDPESFCTKSWVPTCLPQSD